MEVRYSRRGGERRSMSPGQLRTEGLFARLLEAYIRSFAGWFGLGPAIEVLSPAFKARSPQAGTLEKFDTAREALDDALDALNGVRTEAEQRVLELEQARTALTRVLQSKAENEQKLAQIRKIAEADMATFKKMAGVTSPVIAFWSGVFASIVAAALVWGTAQVWPYVFKLLEYLRSST